MSQLKEILEKEHERDDLAQYKIIHLFREGTFYRAYEWSAWLCQQFFTELKVTHRLLKNGEDIGGVSRIGMDCPTIKACSIHRKTADCPSETLRHSFSAMSI